MNNEKEIERIKNSIGWVAGLVIRQKEVIARNLSNAGIGDKKQAVKEAFDKLLSVLFSDSYHLADVFIDDEWLSLYDLVSKRANTVITELYGADE